MVYVGLVDSHAEGRRSHDYVVAQLVEEPVLRRLVFLVVCMGSAHCSSCRRNC